MRRGFLNPTPTTKPGHRQEHTECLHSSGEKLPVLVESSGGESVHTSADSESESELDLGAVGAPPMAVQQTPLAQMLEKMRSDPAAEEKARLECLAYSQQKHLEEIAETMQAFEEGQALKARAAEERTQAASFFEFSLFFWAPSAEKIREQERRKQEHAERQARQKLLDEDGGLRSSSKGLSRGNTLRGGVSEQPAPHPELDFEMRWALRKNNLRSSTSYDFKKTEPFLGVLERVRVLGMELAVATKLAGAYEVELGAGFEDGVYVPSLMAAGKALNKTHGPFVGLHRVESFSGRMLAWAADMGWYWNDDPHEPAGDPHGLLREPYAKTMDKYDADDEASRTGIRISSVSGAVGLGQHGSVLPVAAENSQDTAVCTYTSEVGQTPRVREGLLEVYVFRIKLPPGHKKIFSDGTCVVCLAADSACSNAACGHVALCHSCYRRMQHEPCPLCRCTEPGVTV